MDDAQSICHVYCHMCAAFAIVYKRLLASQPAALMINIDKPKSLLIKKSIITGHFWTFLAFQSENRSFLF